MAQVDRKITVKKLAAGAGVLVAAALCVKLLFSPADAMQLDATAMQALTTEHTFKTTLGDGSRAVHVFLSIDCTFCHQIEPELDKLENVTVYRHLLPGKTDESSRRTLGVWCAQDQLKAWKEVVAGRTTSAATCNGYGLEKNLLLAKRLGLTSTPSIVYESGKVSAGMLSAAKITAMLAEASNR
jgi:thiol:disulfide interchange protein DsbC